MQNKHLEVSQLEGPFKIPQLHSHLLSSDSDNEDILLQGMNDLESPPTLYIDTQLATSSCSLS